MSSATIIPGAPAPSDGPAPTGARTSRLITGLSRARGFSIVAALLVLVFAMSISKPAFATVDNLVAILLSASIIAVLAGGQAIVVISGNVDLSIASIVGLSAFIAGQLLRDGASMAVAILSVLVLGGVLGFVNGILVGLGKAPSIVVTLGTLNVYRGILLAVAGGKEISGYDLPRAYLDIASNSVVGVPILVLVALLVVVVLAVSMHWTVAGRRIYALGSNPAGARVLGLKATRLTIGVFVLSGVVAAIAGVLWGSRYATVNSGAATGLELTVLTAVVVGGVNIFGGSGTVFGAVVGATLLATITNSLTLLSVSPFWLGAIQGLLILGAIGTDATVRAYVQRLATRGGRRA